MKLSLTLERGIQIRMNKLCEDLSKLTTIPTSKLESLCSLACYCIDEELLETHLSGEEVMQYDIGLGTLLITIRDNQVKYKFIPSTQLEANIVNSLKTKQNSLSNKIEKTLVDSIVNTYKDML